ncbi:outer membrane receptor for ferrienterochelin and colicin [Luteimonas cucumeris]|uniref:Outer membrane receptor for ferrienterochelin and colicin n=1 Tax=Luteimonas cucumeris TaxID=985012 RepID=A0A562L7C6_9GAMM|nr:TonB-dependent receptor [Luteimonas cucumeris]TWI03559.1 outer membrane receptor for ferrienterochelin and colicin [Luteimonas cucumeris]
MNSRALRKTVLCMAMGACLATLSPLALAQSVTGAVAGRADAGAQVTVTNTATGLTRTATADANGSFRLSQLPIGQYRVQVSREGQAVGEPVPVSVGVGGTTTVNLGGIGDLDTVTVVGSRVINRVDVRSTETATNINRQELARLPVDQNLASVALLAPGVVATGATFGGLTFGGSSVAENAVYINGLNVTDPYLRQGYSSVPFAFYEEFQVKTGGYSAEFGRSTGGVINAVTRSGSNEFHAGIGLTFEPSGWKSAKEDHFHTDGTVDERDRTSRDESSLFKTNLWASGPIVRDRLFFFAMYEMRDGDSRDIDTTEAWFTDSNDDFWGTKLDWKITDNHLLEFLAFSDEAESVTTNYGYTWDTDTLGKLGGDSNSGSGGDNWSLTYTGHFTDSFSAKAMYGVNERSALSSSPGDAACSIVSRDSSYTELFGDATVQEGCHPTNSSINSRYDKREAARLDFEWTLGDHFLRFGLDQEEMDSDSSRVYPGDGVSYTVLGIPADADPEDRELPNGEDVPVGVTAYVDARRYITGAPVSTKAQAIYIEDNWSVTPNLLLSLGVRADKFENTLASGATFAKADFSDMISPRLGFSWDMKGDGTTKLFGNAGRYYIPLTNKLTDYFGGGTTDEHTYYVLDGWTQQTDPVTGATYLLPDIGSQIGPVNTEGNAPAPDDVRTAVARDLKQVFQDEYILGFQQAINQEWSYGVNATYRETTRAVEDVRTNHVEGCDWYSGDWPILNPGEKNTLWCPDTESWVTFDNSKDGYIASGSGAVMGYKKPKRTYKAVEFQLDRAWDDKWAFNASYVWSKSEGNIEGPVNSDTGYADTNLVQYYDHPAVNERHGVLFNDHRHQFKLRGSYKLNDMFSFGATFSAISGGPITAFGVRWPNDNRSAGGPGEFSGGGSGWLCVSGCSDYTTRQLEYSPRGAFGRLPWVKDLGLNVTFTPFADIDLKARFSIYNVLNDQAVVNVHSRYESTPGTRMPYFGQGTVWQSPRYMQLLVTYSF